MKKITILVLLSAFFCTMTHTNEARAQKEQGDLVISAGAGWGFGTGILNALAKAVGDSTSIKTTVVPTLNAMVDFAVADGFSMGVAYTYNGWKFGDTYTDTSTVPSTTSEATVAIARHNVGVRPLFHFGDNDDVDLYVGARLAYSIWTLDVSSTSGTSSNYDSYDRGNVFTVQALFGVRKYFTENIGIHGEVGIGNSPYFVAGGLSIKL